MTTYDKGYLYIGRIGTEEKGARIISNLVGEYGLSRYDENSLRYNLNKHGVWTSKNGFLQVRRVEWIDYIKSKYRKK